MSVGLSDWGEAAQQFILDTNHPKIVEHVYT